LLNITIQAYETTVLENNIKVDFKETRCYDTRWINLFQHVIKYRRL